MGLKFFSCIPPNSLIQEVREDEMSAKPDAENPASDYPIVTFLGTGASIPSKYRCVSGILVEVDQNNFAILDCGEGRIKTLKKMKCHRNEILFF